MTEQKKIIDSMIQEYHTNAITYLQMKDYYDGEQDIISTYKRELNRNNQIIIDNNIQKFVDEEVNYTLGNSISYVCKSGDRNIINAIDSQLFHYKSNHNQLLMKDLEIYTHKTPVYFSKNDIESLGYNDSISFFVVADIQISYCCFFVLFWVFASEFSSDEGGKE